MSPTVRRTVLAALACGSLAMTAACGGSGFSDGGGSAAAPSSSSGGSAGGSTAPVSGASLQVLIASSGAPETKAVTDAANAWASTSGNKVTVTPAQDQAQQLSQGFASGNPPDVFYVDASKIGDYAKAGNLEPYGDSFPGKDSFTKSLLDAFTYEGKLYCIPKDASTLALEINTDLWKKAGLADADIPTTWDQLETVAKKLTAGKVVGLAIGDTRDRIGALMQEAGGWIVGDDGKTVTADSPENLQALQYLQKLLKEGVAKYPKQLSAGWAGEAFGKQTAAMTIEGNWIVGGLKSDYPGVKYQVAELPAGAKGKGTLTFTNCWGIAAQSKNKAAAQQLVQALTTSDQQMKFADAFGVMPSRDDALPMYEQKFPAQAAFVAGAKYGKGPVNAPGMTPVLADFDTQLQKLPGADPKQILSSLQKNASAALK
ncbi:multiple sugar transport system substrate-binding protein [Motilibacter peucedani]|uniref:Multiple sugar transport system substrate-binding protein n=1 Tax=Motilibacter peucedani TaxID=598650 RepID=A0A420XMZ4_9ACTN|nr:extracellular solute-binding protein [Motilibacter peucedani]RKS72645.1 multiple sugar transport system substrate-binding protein [Motilibacter peucedani]